MTEIRLLLAITMFLSGSVMHAAQPDASEQEIRDSIALGAYAYADNCSQCHQPDGYGEEALFPAINRQSILQDQALLIKTILHGRQGENAAATGTETLMPPLDFLSNREIAAIIAFISNSWADGVLLVSEEEVAQAR